jgi:hypothetical protein
LDLLNKTPQNYFPFILLYQMKFAFFTIAALALLDGPVLAGKGPGGLRRNAQVRVGFHILFHSVRPLI